MSSRAARRLLQKRNELSRELDQAPSDTDDVDSVVPAALATKAFNPFALIGTGDDEAVADEAEEDDATSSRSPEPVPAATKSKKKNKKKKKKPASAAESGSEGDLDEIDRALKELNAKEPLEAVVAVEKSTAATTNAKTSRSLLCVDIKHLDADAELKRMFGSRVVAEELKKKRYVKPDSRYGRTLLVTPRDGWPRFVGRFGIGMDLLEAPSNPGESFHPGLFQFTCSPTYLEAEAMFRAAVDTNDPESLMRLLHAFPFHANTLLQLSEVARHQGNLNNAAEYIERTLFLYERAFHALFNIGTASCGLSYEAYENRAFFLAIYRHIGFVQRKGCWRTCLELCKLLLALDSETDPLGAILMIDFYAIKSGELDWLQQLWLEWAGENGDGAAGLPNFSYSIALASYMKEVQSDKAVPKSTNLLRRAILDYPAAVLQILAKCAVTDARISALPLFTTAANLSPSEDAVDILITLYVAQCFNLWKEPETLLWLRDTAAKITETADFESRVAAGSEMRRTAYPDGLPLNCSRHIFVSEFQTQLAQRLPRSATKLSLHAFNPMPPPASNDGADDGRFGLGRLGSGLMWLMGRAIENIRGIGRARDDDDDDDDDDAGDDDGGDEEGTDGGRAQ
ncbi:transcriptional repressor TCF25-domain-containing protein [Zopfochytrium polystomum]|nr:transcriptional repressor TCF25-domain-containing protein [Zopfochytrium polystomum]